MPFSRGATPFSLMLSRSIACSPITEVYCDVVSAVPEENLTLRPESWNYRKSLYKSDIVSFTEVFIGRQDL